MHNSQEIWIYGIIMAVSCYIYPFIASDLSLNHLGANIYTSKEFVMMNDPTFVKSYKVHTIQAVLDYKDTHFTILVKEQAP